ncbi:hypothetical protein [Mesorhizobium sp. B2-6-4]|uniref:hypothetical protein n=1 Tax=Mesorhizobium sp. B2-6-4 TaxID=2589913 RepID=UPI001FF05682|nr:hypothetical protein [Mesorhizobium sp. B2-6-4]
MGEINLTDSEKHALQAIDERELDNLIDQAVKEEHLGVMHRLPLSSCGIYAGTKLHYFEAALREYRESKSAKKREEKHYQATRAGSDLSFAFRSMKQRMETEEREGQLFHVDDNISAPYRFSKNLEVRISYRWRRTVEDAWTPGSITFHHEVYPRPVYTLPRPKRKPSVAKQAQDLQDELHQTWVHFMRIALYTVRDYFREGGAEAKSLKRSNPQPILTLGG